jgi:pimeloyl-ACP methyl ester carboxylesterase
MKRPKLTIGVLLAFGLVLGGCNSSSDYDFEASADQAQITYEAENEIAPRPLFNPAEGILPSATDLLFIGSEDYTLNIPIDPSEPAGVQALKATLNELDGFSTTAPITVNFSTTLGSTSVSAGASVCLFEVTIDPALGGAVTGVTRELTADEYLASVTGENLQILVLQPLQPLKQGTHYLAVFTRAITDPDGVPAAPDTVYRLLKSSEELTGEIAELEPLRLLTGSFEAAAATQGIDPADVVLSWVFTTESITPVLNAVVEMTVPGDIEVTPTTFATAKADIYVGSLALPYYLTAASPTDPTAPLTEHWSADTEGAPLTWFSPQPVVTGTETIPLLMTVPNAQSNVGGTPPADGWPVVIFQHGITGDRTSMLGIADRLADEGFAVLAIDLPLHGIADPDNGLYTGIERTFDLDLVDNATGEPGPDGVIDPSGQHFINLQYLLTSRDNLRQAVADLLVLRESLGAVTSPPLNAGQVHFLGHSLGGIVGTVYLAMQEDLVSASLAMPGGGIARLLEGSATLGPIIQEALAANGLIPGTGEFDSFMVVAQTALDAGDPINFAATAALNHPIHMIEVVGGAGSLPDQVVPNTVAGAPLSGTEPLAAMMGLAAVTESTAGVDGIVRFTAGDHRSVLDPTASPLATLEMQHEIAGFFSSDGTKIDITYPSVIAQ